jgi:hypothetical protein
VPVQAVLHTISPAAAAASADAGAVSFSVVDASSADAPSTWQAPQQWMQVSSLHGCYILMLGLTMSLHASMCGMCSCGW